MITRLIVLLFLAVPTPEERPLSRNYRLIRAADAAGLVQAVFQSKGGDPSLPYGKYKASSHTVTATPDSGYFKILLKPGINTRLSGSIACSSSVPLSEWLWYEKSSKQAGQNRVWTRRGWEPIRSGKHMKQAFPYKGLYYYRVDLNDVEVGPALGAFIASKDQAARVQFYHVP